MNPLRGNFAAIGALNLDASSRVQSSLFREDWALSPAPTGLNYPVD